MSVPVPEIAPATDPAPPSELSGAESGGSPNDTIDRLVRSVEPQVCFVVILVAIAGAAAGRVDVAAGFVLGGIGSLINFRLLARNAKRLQGLDPKGAARQSFSSSGGRFAMLGAFLAVAALLPETFNFAGCAAGLFVTQAVLIFAGMRLAKG